MDVLYYALVSRLHLRVTEDSVMPSEYRLKRAESEICAMDIDAYIYYSFHSDLPLYAVSPLLNCAEHIQYTGKSAFLQLWGSLHII